MESQRKIMKPLFHLEVIINNNLAYHTFLRKGSRTFSRLVLRTTEQYYSRESHTRDPKSAKLVRVFKKIKFTRKVDLKQLRMINPIPSSSAFLFIAKRMLYVKDLSIYDSRRKETKYKGLYTTWPKYMKQLKSLYSEIWIRQEGGFLITRHHLLPIKMMFPSDFLRFLPRFEEAKMGFPFFQYTSQMDRMCQFKKYPVSMRKISIQHPVYNPLVLKASIEHLKELRSLKIILFSGSISELMESAYRLISQAPVKLHTLNVNFLQNFEVDDSINQSIRRLVNLKKAKIQISSTSALRILQSLEECPLEVLDLRICILEDQEILFVKELISKKKNSLKKLKLLLRSFNGKLRSVSLLEDLIKTIDDLPQLTNLSFSLLVPTLEADRKEELVSLESSLNFGGLLSRAVPLRKFQLISNHLNNLSENRFPNLLKSLRQGVFSNLEKIQIDVGKYEPASEEESEIIINFIKSLAKIQVLKLDNLSVSSRDFSKIIEAILSLRNLTALSIANFSEEISKDRLAQGIGRVLRKYGLRSFNMDSSFDFSKFRDEISERYKSCLNFIDIKKKNPYFVYCTVPLELPKNVEEVW